MALGRSPAGASQQLQHLLALLLVFAFADQAFVEQALEDQQALLYLLGRDGVTRPGHGRDARRGHSRIKSGWSVGN